MNFPCCLAVLIALATASAASAQSASERLHAVFEDYDEWHRLEFPEKAIARGDQTNADRITDQGLVAVAMRNRSDMVFRDRADAVQRSELDETDRLSLELFVQMLDRRIGEYRFNTHLAPLAVLGGPLFEIPQMGQGVPFRNTSDYRDYLSRLEAVPEVIDQYIERMRIGIEIGMTPPRVTLAGIPAQFESLLGPGGLDALADPFDDVPPIIGDSAINRLRDRFDETVVPNLRVALEGFRTFVEDEYIPGCRETLAASELPNGEAFYAFRLQVMTTTPLTAKEIHEIGLAEVERIRLEMLGVIRRSDFMELHPEANDLDDDALFAQFVDYLRTDPRFYHETPEALLSEYRDICKRIDEWMPRLFGELPRLPYGVRPVPDYAAPSTTTAYYDAGSLATGDPGYFVANTYALEQRPRYEMIALTLHEAVPGHHHQVALAQEMTRVPEFRKDIWFTAFGEGWALYAERLGIEMGLYEDPYDDFGRLTYEMWRASRLVVDPGIHTLGWTRDEAIEFMKRHTALSDLNITNEVDRYIAWPGQACGYKIGEIRIRALRAKAEETLGAGFDLRRFHDVVLAEGSLPINVLEKRVDRWISQIKSAQIRVYD